MKKQKHHQPIPFERWVDEHRAQNRQFSWKEWLAEPLAKHLNRVLWGGRRRVELFGPCGICARVDVEFIDPASGWRACLSLEPAVTGSGNCMPCVRRVDKSGSGEYSNGTIGAMNLMNHPLDEPPDRVTAGWYAERMFNLRTRRS